MNSSGLGMLINGLSLLKNSNMQMYLTNVPQKVQKLITITHLDNVFKIFETNEKVIEYL